MALTEITEFTEEKEEEYGAGFIFFRKRKKIKPMFSSVRSSEQGKRVRAFRNSSVFHRLVAIVFTALLLIGAAVRIYGAWQLRHNLNPDSGMVALMAKHIAESVDFPVFFYGQAYMGSLEPFASALFCALFGTSGFMVTLGTAFVGWLVLFAVFAWARDAHSPAAGLAAMAWCMIGPSGFVHYQVSPRGGYAITILLTVLILWLISKLIINGREDNLGYRNFPPQADPPTADKDAAGPEAHALPTGFSDSGKGRTAASLPRRPNSSSIGGWLLLGLLAGLGWWSNQLIVSSIITAALMALIFLRLRVFSLKTLAAAIGFFIGSLPFWWWNVFHDWQSFEFAGSFGQTPFGTGLKLFFLDRLPDLIDVNQGIWVWQIIGAAIYIGAALMTLYLLLKMSRLRQDGRWIFLLTPFIFILVSALLFSTSHFALMNTSRYLLPLVPVLAVIFGVMTAELAKRKYFFLGLIPLVFVIANQAMNLSWLSQRGRGEEAYQRQIEECGRFLQSQQINACYAPYGKHSWNFALQEKICFCDLPQDRYLPYVRRAESADKIAVFDNLGDINNFVAYYGGNAKTVYSGSTPVCYGFTPPPDGLTAVAPDDIDSIRDSLGRDALAEVTDGNIDTGWEGAVTEGDDEWLEISFKMPQTVRMIRLLYSEYPATWQITGQGEDGLWKTLTSCIQTTGYLWSGPRPYWSYGLEGYRLECKIPPEKLKRLRIHRIESGYHLLEMQLFSPAVAPESEYSALKSLVDLIRQRGLKRLYCDRWPANAVFRETQGSVETWLNPNVFGDCSLASSNGIWFTPRTGLLVREEDAPLCRRTLADRMVEMRQTKIGPWVLFDFKPGKWKSEYGRDCELHWAGFACLTKNSKRWAAELVSRSDIKVAKGEAGDAIALLRKASETWPFYPPAVERLARLTAENFKEVGPHSLCGRPNGRSAAGQGCSALPIEQLSSSSGHDLSEAEYWALKNKIISQPETKAEIKFGNGIEFAGLSLSTNEVSAGDSLTVRYYWKYPPDGTVDKIWAFVHFLRGKNILQDDHPLEKFKGAEYQPFPEFFVETRNLVVPKTAPEGAYQIRVGIYDASRTDQKRIAVKTSLPSRLNSVELPVRLTVRKKK